MRRGDVDFAVRLFDDDEFLRRAGSGVNIAESDREIFFAEFKKSGRRLMLENIARSLEGGRYEFLRIRNYPSDRRLLFRMVMSDGGLTYHEFVVYSASGGQAKIADEFFFGVGELNSEVFRRFLLAASAVAGTGDAYSEQIQGLKQLSTLVQQRDYHAALAEYKRLAPELQEFKPAILLRIAAAQRVSDEDYISAVKRFESEFPDDPCLPLYLIHACRLQQDFDKALRAVDQLEKAVGGDPYLNVNRVNLLIDKRQFDDARKLIGELEQWDPMLIEIQWARLNIALQENDFAEVVRRLNKLSEEFGVQLTDLAALPAYGKFIKSPEFEEWQKGSQTCFRE